LSWSPYHSRVAETTSPLPPQPPPSPKIWEREGVPEGRGWVRAEKKRMRCLTIVALLLTVISVTCCGPGPSVTVEPTGTHIPPTATEAPTLTPTAVEPMTPVPTLSQEPTAPNELGTPSGGPMLIMVRIRARSSLEVKQLRQMHLVDIVRVRPDPSRPPSEEELLSGGFIVEAVVTPGILAKLKAKGFEVSEVPPKE
jgi:hypothetical protein